MIQFSPAVSQFSIRVFLLRTVMLRIKQIDVFQILCKIFADMVLAVLRIF